MNESQPSNSWKEQQRALTQRARMGHFHRTRKPGQRLAFPSSAFYEVQSDGSLKRLYVHKEPEPKLG